MKQVLLLDDNPTQLTVRELVLRKGGLESHVATSGHSALALLHSEPGRQRIGLVVTDHIMPDMGGVEFVRQLRSFNPEIPVLVLSGLAEAAHEYDGLNVIFRMKPCDPDEFMQLARAALDDIVTGLRPEIIAEGVKRY